MARSYNFPILLHSDSMCLSDFSCGVPEYHGSIQELECARSAVERNSQPLSRPQILIFVEARRCIYGHELEGYKQANMDGDLEMVGSNREERQGMTPASILGNGVLHDLGDDDDEELTMMPNKYSQD